MKKTAVFIGQHMGDGFGGGQQVLRLAIAQGVFHFTNIFTAGPGQ